MKINSMSVVFALLLFIAPSGYAQKKGKHGFTPSCLKKNLRSWGAILIQKVFQRGNKYSRMKNITISILVLFAMDYMAFAEELNLCKVNKTPKWEYHKLLNKGGRVDWYKGKKHNLIAYDAISDPLTKNTAVYIMQPDGSQKQCITGNSSIPKGFVGQPAWHPDGEHIIIQVENSNS